MYLLVATGRIPNALIATLGAVSMVFLGAMTEEQALAHVDLEVILLLAAMMSLASVETWEDHRGRRAVPTRTGAKFEWSLVCMGDIGSRCTGKSSNVRSDAYRYDRWQ